MDFSQFKDIKDFYQKTGMTPIQAYDFLKKELEGRKGVCKVSELS